MKDRFLSALSNERKFPEVGANSIVSSVACGFHAKCENERADSHTRRAHTHARTLGRAARNADVRKAA